MKTRYFIATVILLLAGLVFNGCDTKKENVEDAKDKVTEEKKE